MAKMTIHRALSELKLIDSKIEKQIAEINPTGVYQKGKLIDGFIKQDDFENNAKSKFDSVRDLIERKNKIKSAVVLKNGETIVSVGGKEMTVADAINYKTLIKFKKQLIESVRKKHLQAVGKLNKGNESINENCQKLLEVTFGKESVKVGEKDLDAVRKPFLEANEFHLCDPLNVDETIGNLEKEVSEFEAEVDAVLSEANAITTIEI